MKICVGSQPVCSMKQLNLHMKIKSQEYFVEFAKAKTISMLSGICKAHIEWPQRLLHLFSGARYANTHLGREKSPAENAPHRKLASLSSVEVAAVEIVTASRPRCAEV